jgi:hypothetical protein
MSRRIIPWLCLLVIGGAAATSLYLGGRPMVQPKIEKTIFDRDIDEIGEREWATGEVDRSKLEKMTADLFGDNSLSYEDKAERFPRLMPIYFSGNVHDVRFDYIKIIKPETLRSVDAFLKTKTASGKSYYWNRVEEFENQIKSASELEGMDKVDFCSYWRDEFNSISFAFRRIHKDLGGSDQRLKHMKLKKLLGVVDQIDAGTYKN